MILIQMCGIGTTAGDLFVIKQCMRITRAVIVGTEHLCSKRFPESARSADANQSLRCTNLRIKQVNQHGFVNIIRVGDELKTLISGVYILTVLVFFCHVQCPPPFEFSIVYLYLLYHDQELIASLYSIIRLPR